MSDVDPYSDDNIQAPDFYRARGFTIVGEVMNYLRGFRYLTLVKSLD